MTRTFHALFFGIALLASASAFAQVNLPVTSAPVAASGEDSRLRQTETIYQLQLRTKHIPVLSKYITDLQKLAAQSPNPVPYQKEIERIQGIIANGGVVDLAAAVQSLKTPAEAPVQQPPPMPARVARALLALTPALARSISPTPDSSASPEAAAVGEIEWKIETLPAGTYDLVLNYACPSVTESLTIAASLGGQRVDATLDASKATPDATTYRVLRLGQITLHAETRGDTLRLTAGAKDANTLLVRQLVIARARAASN